MSPSDARRPTRRSGRDRRPGARFDDAAAALGRIVVLVRAGIPLDRIGDFADADAARMVAIPPPPRVEERGNGSHEQALVTALVMVCRTAGAPLGPALQRQCEVLRVVAHGFREAEIAASGPRATARIVALLPLVGILVASLLGFDVVGVLSSTALGTAVTVVGLLLSFAGAAWARRIVRRVRPSLVEPGHLHDLVATGLDGGLSVEGALELAASATRSGEGGERRDEAVADIRRVVRVAHRSGAGLRDLLLAQADLRRQQHSAEERLRIERLATDLLAPLGLCSLPAFLLLGVVPALLAVVSSTVHPG